MFSSYYRYVYLFRAQLLNYRTCFEIRFSTTKLDNYNHKFYIYATFKLLIQF